MKEKTEPDRLKVQERDSCFVPLSMIYVPCLPRLLCLRHVCKELDKYPSGMEVLMSQPRLVQNHGKVPHFFAEGHLGATWCSAISPWQGGEMR